MAPHLVIQGKPTRDNINNNYQIIVGTLAADMCRIRFHIFAHKKKDNSLIKSDIRALF